MTMTMSKKEKPYIIGMGGERIYFDSAREQEPALNFGGVIDGLKKTSDVLKETGTALVKFSAAMASAKKKSKGRKTT